MRITTYTELRQNLASMLDSVNNNHETVIVTRSGAKPAVLMSLEDFNSYKETLYLTASKENKKRLDRSIEQLENGVSVETTLDELNNMVD